MYILLEQYGYISNEIIINLQNNVSPLYVGAACAAKINCGRRKSK